MFQTLSYQLYAATEQQASGVPAGQLAAGVRDLRVRLYRAFGPRHRVRPARRPVAAARILPSGRQGHQHAAR